MKKKEYLDWLANKNVDKKRVKKIQEVYRLILPVIIQKIISNNDESIFFDDEYRILSFREIVDANYDLHVDFKGKGLIPLVDCGENDFIVYLSNEEIWAKFNIVDETIFRRKNTIEEMLN